MMMSASFLDSQDIGSGEKPFVPRGKISEYDLNSINLDNES